MPNTFTLIASSTVGAGGASTIDFTSIPNTYTDLFVCLSARGTASQTNVGVKIVLNSSTSNFTFRDLYADKTSVSSGSASTGAIGYVSAATDTASCFSYLSQYIPNYTASVNKSISTECHQIGNSTIMQIEPEAMLWSNTAAITSIGYTINTGLFAQYTTAYLYGVKNA